MIIKTQNVFQEIKQLTSTLSKFSQIHVWSLQEVIHISMYKGKFISYFQFFETEQKVELSSVICLHAPWNRKSVPLQIPEH